MFSDGLFDLLDESAPSLPAPACSTNTIIYEEENEDLQGQPLSLASTTSPLIKKGLFNVQVLVTDFTGTWTELETVYLLAKDTNPTVAYQKVAPRANLTTNTTSTDKNIVHAQILRKTQPLGDNSPFREPHEPVLVRIQRWGKNGANRLSYWENDAIRRMQPPPLDMLQDDSYVYAVFPAGPLLHSSPSTEGLLHHDRPTNTAENDTNKNSLEYHRPDNTTDDSHDGNQIEPSQYDVSVGSDKNNKPIPDCQVQLTRGLPDDPEMEQVQTNHRQIDGPELNCKRKDHNLQNKVEKQEDTAEFLVRNKEQSMEWINNAYS